MILVVGLGNPGREYSASKHNVGFMVLDALLERFRIASVKKGFSGLFGEATVAEQRVMLLKPQTYMNLSGASVSEASQFFKIPAENIISVYDEMDLALGVIKIKLGGGSAGHRGVESIRARLGSDKFTRVRVGIGKPRQGGDTTSHVLSGFARDERRIIDEATLRAADAVVEIIENGAAAAMNKFNQKQDTESK
ncbi:MAG: aminoacyl-tRNA hydrolase [Deltaproteobacteria bacterium]